jgi:hypothetical protein
VFSAVKLVWRKDCSKLTDRKRDIQTREISVQKKKDIISRTKSDNTSLREELGRQDRRLEDIFDLLQKQVKNLSPPLFCSPSPPAGTGREPRSGPAAPAAGGGSRGGEVTPAASLFPLSAEVRLLKKRVETGVEHSARSSGETEGAVAALERNVETLAAQLWELDTNNRSRRGRRRKG